MQELVRQHARLDHGRVATRETKKGIVTVVHMASGSALRDVMLLTLVYFMGSIGIYEFIIRFPTIVKLAYGPSTGIVTRLETLPYFD